jgi:hypothetical protein
MMTTNPTHSIRKPSEHGLGQLLNPTDPDNEDRNWIDSVWVSIVSGSKLEASWLDRPAVSRITASSPAVLQAFRFYNAHLPFAERVKPSNFLMSVHITGFEASARGRFHLVAPYNRDPRQWRKLRWVDIYSGRRFAVTTSAGSTSAVRVKSYHDVIGEYRTHPEFKSLSPDRSAPSRESRGLLPRRTVRVGEVRCIGKESNRIEDVELGLVNKLDDVLTEYSDPTRERWERVVLPWLRSRPKDQVAKLTGISTRQIQRYKHGAMAGHRQFERLVRAAGLTNQQ